MKWFWIGLFTFLSFLVVSAAIMRPDTVDSTLAFTGLFLTVTAWVVLAGLAGAVFIGGGLMAWWWWKRNSVESLRQRDGHYPLQRIKLANGNYVYIDPNQTVGPALQVDRRTGEIYEHEPAAGWAVQSTIRGMVEQTRRAQAMFQGDASRSTQWGSQHKGDRITAAAAKLTAGGYDKQVTIDAPLPPEPPQLTRSWTAREAFNNNTSLQFVMGQTDTGELISWRPAGGHLRVHGFSQGSGKTNLIQTVAAGAARLGLHLVVLDRRKFKDWGEFQGYGELVDTRDPRRFAAAVLTLRDMYQARDELLGQHGAPNIGALQNPPKRVIVVISEFGAACQAAADEGMLKDVLGPLVLIMREAAATGVHVVLEDQAVDKRWPLGISANAEPVTGYLPKNYGSTGGYDYAHQLAPHTFHYAGAVFKTWHMQPELAGLLRSAPEMGAPLIRVQEHQAGSSQPVHGLVHDEFTGQFMGSSPEVDPPLPLSVNTSVNTAPDTVDGWYEWTLDNYLSRHPELLQLDERGRGIGIMGLAVAMARENGKTTKQMGGTASEVAKRLRVEVGFMGGSGATYGFNETGGKKKEEK